jgi:hypothetical protein
VKGISRILCSQYVSDLGDIWELYVLGLKTTILVSVRNQNLNWLILSADTVTDTETTFQRENLVTNSMGYFFNHKRDP